MSLAGVSTRDEPQRATSGVPVILGIALDEVSRRRLATVLDGAGVVMFTHDVATARAFLDGRTADTPGAAGTDDRHDEPVIRIGELEVDLARCRVRWREVPMAVTRQERELLAGLAAGPARVWTYRQLHSAAWDGSYLDPGPVHAAVKRLRRKLRETGVPVRIDAVRGVGYQLVELD